MLNLNYNLNASNIERARFTEQESKGFRPFQIQYFIVPGGGGSAAGNNQPNSGSLPLVGIAGNGGVIASGSYCVQPFVTYPIVVGSGGAGGIKGVGASFTGSNGSNSSFYNITAIGGDGGKSQLYITSSTFAGSGARTSASIANGGSGSQWTYNLPGCLPPTPGCHGGELISSSFYSGGGAGIAVSQSFSPAVPISFSYLIAAGGGAGASKTSIAGIEAAGGGGAGAILSGSFNPFTDDPNWTNYLVNGILTFPVVVGAGGLAVLNSTGNNGSGSSLFGFSTQGGQGGLLSGNGGNSGTGSANSNFTTQYNGGTGTFGGGGAGARANGTAGTDLGGGTYDAGDGGIGALWSGSYYGGGGASAISVGAGTVYYGTDGNGSTNPGGGGASNFGGLATNGRSGSVIIKYPIAGLGYFADLIQGGNISYDGGYKIHTFTQNGNFTIKQGLPILEVDYIVVGGGGAGVNNQDTCNGGATFGGGGGAVITGSFVVEPIVRTYPIVVGAGGIGKYGCDPGTGSEAGDSSAFGSRAQGGRSGNTTDTIGGNSGTGSWGLTTPFLGSDAVSASAGAGGAGAAGTGSAVYQLSPGLWKDGYGGIGLQWVDGRYYAGGGGGGTQDATDFQGQPGLTSELIPSTQFYPGRGGTGVPGNFYFAASNGNSGSVVIRYFGTGSKATGGQIQYSGSYTYHIFTASGEFTLNENTSSIFASGLAGVGSGNALFSPSGSLSLTPYVGGGAAASYYNQNGVSGSDGFVAIRYEGLPLAEGGNIVITDHYTYHLFSSSGNFYVIGQESNPNINPCP